MSRVPAADVPKDPRSFAAEANGLDRRYPSGNTELLDHIGDVGLLLSELPPGTTPAKNRLIARNGSWPHHLA